MTQEFLCVSGSVLMDSQINASQPGLSLAQEILSSSCHPVLLSPSWFQVDDPAAALKELETHLGFPLQGFVPYTRSVRPGMEIPKDRLQKYLEDVLGAHPTGIASENLDIQVYILELLAFSYNIGTEK